ncbi:hypothetical protein ACXVUM_13395 [Williamsia sp. SKLECPSW1]
MSGERTHDAPAPLVWSGYLAAIGFLVGLGLTPWLFAEHDTMAGVIALVITILLIAYAATVIYFAIVRTGSVSPADPPDEKARRHYGEEWRSTTPDDESSHS